MLTYTPPSDDTELVRRERPWMLLLLCVVWLWPGIFGHDPWKPDEPYVLGVVQSYLAHGQWAVPTIAGVSYLDSSPLYYWVAAMCARAFSPWLLPLADAVRLATPLFMALALWFIGLAGRDLIGPRHGRSAVLLTIGCLGLMPYGHAASPDIATFCGFALAFWALSLARERSWQGGLLLALASTVTVLSSSLMEVALLWTVAILLPAFHPWRNRNYALALIVALVLALPASLVWPVLLKKTHPALFEYWWQYQALGPFNGFARFNLLHESGYYFKLFPWFTWPAWPLALWTLWQRRAHLNDPVLLLSGMTLLVVALLMTLSSREAQASALLLLPPLVVLAAAELDSLRRGAAGFFNWFGVMTFGLLAAFIWLAWWAINFGWPEQLAARARYFNPSYQPDVSLFAVVIALLMSAVWIWAVTRKRLQGRQAITNWATGVTLVWTLAATLWLPWLDTQKRYREVVADMMSVLPNTVLQGAQCVVADDNNLGVFALWQYYAGLRLRDLQSDAGQHCVYQLVVANEHYLPDTGWQTVWRGTRAGEKHEWFYLLQRRGSS